MNNETMKQRNNETQRIKEIFKKIASFSEDEKGQISDETLMVVSSFMEISKKSSTTGAKQELTSERGRKKFEIDTLILEQNRFMMGKLIEQRNMMLERFNTIIEN